MAFGLFLFWGFNGGFNKILHPEPPPPPAQTTEAKATPTPIPALATPTPACTLGTKDNPIWENDVPVAQLEAMPEGIYILVASGLLWVTVANHKVSLAEPEPRPTPIFREIPRNYQNGADGQPHEGTYEDPYRPVWKTETYGNLPYDSFFLGWDGKLYHKIDNYDVIAAEVERRIKEHPVIDKN
jgi:hypothetical protein